MLYYWISTHLTYNIKQLSKYSEKLKKKKIKLKNISLKKKYSSNHMMLHWQGMSYSVMQGISRQLKGVISIGNVVCVYMSK